MPADFLRNVNAAYPAPTPVTCGSLCRSPEHLRMVLAQFDVVSNPRYQPRAGATFCNIFVWDCTRALAAEIPHWLNGRELNANELVAWLYREGRHFDWWKVDAPEARAAADAGRPVVATWRNPVPTKSGHVAMILPGGRIAQAGARCLFDVPLVEGFGQLAVEFWAHS